MNNFKYKLSKEVGANFFVAFVFLLIICAMIKFNNEIVEIFKQVFDFSKNSKDKAEDFYKITIVLFVGFFSFNVISSSYFFEVFKTIQKAQNFKKYDEFKNYLKTKHPNIKAKIFKKSFIFLYNDFFKNVYIIDDNYTIGIFQGFIYYCHIKKNFFGIYYISEILAYVDFNEEINNKIKELF